MNNPENNNITRKNITSQYLEKEKHDANLDFLHKRLSKSINVYALLSSQMFTQRFSELVQTNVTIDDAMVYREIRDMAFPIFEQISQYEILREFKAAFVSKNGLQAYKTFWHDYKVFHKTLSSLSYILFGSSEYWEVEYKNTYGKKFIEPLCKSKEAISVPDGNEDIAYILDICNKLSRGSLRLMVSDKNIVDALRKHGFVCTMEEAFDVVKPVFYKCARLGFRNKDEDSRKIYFNRRRIVEDFCKKIYGDKNYWHSDYEKAVN